jgi:predicted ribosomally synthesized peptide with SipW-like signal peptide
MKKIGLLCLALVLALGTIGIGYATWSDNVTVEQTVKTGDFKVGVADMGTNDANDWCDIGDDGPCNDPGYDKHVATCTSQNVSAVEFSIGGTDYYSRVKETIDNGYPCYSCNITFEFANGGSIPAKLKSWTTTVTDGDPLLCGCVELASWQLTKPDGSIVSGTSYCELETKLKELQLHENDKFQLIITKHILQDCPDGQGGTYECPQGANCTMEHEAKWVQWNKIDE